MKFSSLTDNDLSSNFTSVLHLFGRIPDSNLWKKILVSISRAVKMDPPQLGIRTLFVPVFDALETLKEKIGAQGPSYDLYVLVNSESTNVFALDDFSVNNGPYTLKYTLGIFGDDLPMSFSITRSFDVVRPPLVRHGSNYARSRTSSLAWRHRLSSTIGGVIGHRSSVQHSPV